MAVAISLVMCARTIIRARHRTRTVESSKNYRRLISLLVYNTPPAFVNLLVIPVHIMATHYSFLPAEQMINDPFFESFLVVSSINERFIEACPIVLTLCTIVAYQQYRQAALSVLLCKSVNQVRNKRQIVDTAYDGLSMFRSR
ncbi:unnamed protein product [Toxocara canis]|uniref:G protein-coupled receptor n=1 Tax=Toxocara canis TaxID=6265 RepID=A0A183U4X0_TOXCA|nr:unnamed protein product [Toxocara canis]